ncbi:FecR family protein [Pedobacter sp. MW01-1-1]|uniref:FecR family protein n=1 Tax=Pedobacter sp. MW01-1-1 TaxID=3383027 RepID=UPI003FED4934
MESPILIKSLYISELVSKFRNSTLSEEEKQELHDWIQEKPANKVLFDELMDAEKQREAIASMSAFKNKSKTLAKILSFPVEETKGVKIKQYTFFKYAAAILVVVSVGIGVFFYQEFKKTPESTPIMASTVKPGSNKAKLVLADGRSIDLKSTKNGVRLQEGNLLYDDGTDIAMITNSTMLNTISTPRGGKYEMELPDGTKVWLNAESSIKFPASFKGLSKREIILTGEAYFEVAKAFEASSGRDGKKINNIPFLVHTNNQTIEVLGTHFNVNAYADEESTRTSLIEGQVRVVLKSADSKKQSVVLKPRQQSELKGKSLKVSSIDVKEAVAWKNNYFVFNNEELSSIMKKIARWYNINVIYEAGYKPLYFSGSFPATENLATAMHVLELTGNVHYRVEYLKNTDERRIIMMP